MKLEYIPEGSTDCPLIRLYEFESSEAKEFHGLLTRLANGELNQVALHDLPFIAAIQECSLNLIADENNKGISLINDNNFECLLTVDNWSIVADLVVPFFDGTKGFQWLDETGEISLLLSPSGKW
ncbi:MAG: hypothetical protein ABIK15_03310 [Pseudomonadota bacterium]